MKEFHSCKQGQIVHRSKVIDKGDDKQRERERKMKKWEQKDKEKRKKDKEKIW